MGWNDWRFARRVATAARSKLGREDNVSTIDGLAARSKWNRESVRRSGKQLDRNWVESCSHSLLRSASTLSQRQLGRSWAESSRVSGRSSCLEQPQQQLGRNWTERRGPGCECAGPRCCRNGSSVETGPERVAHAEHYREACASKRKLGRNWAESAMRARCSVEVGPRAELIAERNDFVGGGRNSSSVETGPRGPLQVMSYAGVGSSETEARSKWGREGTISCSVETGPRA
jgi:hypothetical protein